MTLNVHCDLPALFHLLATFGSNGLCIQDWRKFPWRAQTYQNPLGTDPRRDQMDFHPTKKRQMSIWGTHRAWKMDLARSWGKKQEPVPGWKQLEYNSLFYTPAPKEGHRETEKVAKVALKNKDTTASKLVKTGSFNISWKTITAGKQRVGDKLVTIKSEVIKSTCRMYPQSPSTYRQRKLMKAQHATPRVVKAMPHRPICGGNS